MLLHLEVIADRGERIVWQAPIVEYARRCCNTILIGGELPCERYAGRVQLFRRVVGAVGVASSGRSRDWLLAVAMDGS